MLKKIKLQDFTAFDELETSLVPGVNIFAGANGTGKTHLLKFLYAFDSTEIIHQNLSEFMKKIIRSVSPSWKKADKASASRKQ